MVSDEKEALQQGFEGKGRLSALIRKFDYVFMLQVILVREHTWSFLTISDSGRPG